MNNELLKKIFQLTEAGYEIKFFEENSIFIIRIYKSETQHTVEHRIAYIDRHVSKITVVLSTIDLLLSKLEEVK